MRIRSTTAFLAIFLALCSCNNAGYGTFPEEPAPAATPQAKASTPQAKKDLIAKTDPRLDWWREARFGMFIHWGLYAVPAGKWGDSTKHAEWIMTTAQIPVPKYEEFLGQFNPVKFDADAWVRKAKAAGMDYIVITSKHHDGFALFDSKVSDYDIMATPFKRDIMKELADACRKHDIKICWYHSIMDWHHPDYLPRRGWEKPEGPKHRSAEGADYARYVEYMRAQVKELMTNYGDIGIMWFDGEWEGTWAHEQGLELYKLCRELQPGTIVNDRVDKGRRGHSGIIAEGYAGDYGTPEQNIPAEVARGIDWETCMTMNGHWGWNEADKKWKSSTDLIQKLVDIASKGGNFLLNIGPKADGTFPAEADTRLEDMGAWMKVNGAAVKGTKGSILGKPDWGRCTVAQDGDKLRIYLSVFDWPKDGKLIVPGLGSLPTSVYVLADKTKLQHERADTDLLIHVPVEAPNAHASVIVVEIEGDPLLYLSPKILTFSSKFYESRKVELEASSTLLSLHYTLDGSDPQSGSPRYDKPLEIDSTCTLRVRAYHDNRPVSAIVEEKFERVPLQRAERMLARAPTMGLFLETYQGSWDKLPDFKSLTPVSTARVKSVRPGLEKRAENVGHVLTGFLRVQDSGLYTLSLESDDGSNLYLGGKIAIDNDGLHGMKAATTQVALEAGYHKLRIEHFNKGGEANLRLRFARPGTQLRPVGKMMLWYRP
jgi:alpha-L-fucosidase